MRCLSSAIYEWDGGDYQRLMEAKRGDGESRSEPPLWCCSADFDTGSASILPAQDERSRRDDISTRSVVTLLSATDTLGMPLLKEEMGVICKEKQHHVPCQQDPPNVELYTLIDYTEKGGVRLPLFRCARGSTSLESFHLQCSELPSYLGWWPG